MKFVNVYKHADGSRSISNEDYDSYGDALLHKDDVKEYVGTFSIFSEDDIRLHDSKLRDIANTIESLQKDLE